MIDEEEAVFGKYIKKGGFAPRWRPQKQGETLKGKIVYIRRGVHKNDDIFCGVQTPPRFQCTIKRNGEFVNSEPGSVIETPGNVQLINVLKRENVQEQDLIMIKYAGEVKSKRGRNAKIFDIAIIHRNYPEYDEAEKIMFKVQTPVPVPQPAPVKQPVSPPPPTAPAQPQAPPEEAPKPVPEGIPPEQADEIRKYVKDYVFGFLNKLRLEDFDAYINKIRGFNVPVEKVLELCKDICYRDGDVIHKR